MWFCHNKLEYAVSNKESIIAVGIGELMDAFCGNYFKKFIVTVGISELLDVVL